MWIVYFCKGVLSVLVWLHRREECDVHVCDGRFEFTHTHTHTHTLSLSLPPPTFCFVSGLREKTTTTERHHGRWRSNAIGALPKGEEAPSEDGWQGRMPRAPRLLRLLRSLTLPLQRQRSDPISLHSDGSPLAFHRSQISMRSLEKVRSSSFAVFRCRMKICHFSSKSTLPLKFARGTVIFIPKRWIQIENSVFEHLNYKAVILLKWTKGTHSNSLCVTWMNKNAVYCIYCLE